jgi:hypothetical protein
MRTTNLHNRIISILILLATIGWASAGCSGTDSNGTGTPPGTGGQTNPTTTIPNKAGMTLKGQVTCNGAGVAGVVVSDGIEVTTTDSKGIYYLPSKKKFGYVFISTPAGYEVPVSGNTPRFFERVNKLKPAETEQKDFTLTRTDNDKHAVLAMADFHLANRNNDLGQFRQMAADINATVLELRNQGYKVYGLSLGDESWDLYWYENNFSIADAFRQLQQINCPFYHCMGNHDNDPYYADDWQAEQKFIENFPAYYSFNAGKVHYVVMDDIEYLNNGGSIGTVGERNFNAAIAEEEMEWLKKDLAQVSDKSRPLVIALHAPLYDYPSTDADGHTTADYRLDNAAGLMNAVSAFGNVQVLSGHTHVNYNVDRPANVHEHNTAAICATWWWTDKLTDGRQHVCSDGTPGGYGVYLFNGTDMSRYYKAKGHDSSYQFRTYDLNETHILSSDINDPDGQLHTYAHGYDKITAGNEVLVNVWNYDESWKVEVLEAGMPLAVTRIAGYDPLHILAYEVQRISAGHAPTKSFLTTRTAHLFKVRASSATSTLTIRVTDGFGRVYTEEMVRPKAFGLTMK